jgi:hypothetical protein
MFEISITFLKSYLNFDRMIPSRKSSLELYEFMSVSKELKKLLGLFFPFKKSEDYNRVCFVLPFDQKNKIK